MCVCIIYKHTHTHIHVQLYISIRHARGRRAGALNWLRHHSGRERPRDGEGALHADPRHRRRTRVCRLGPRAWPRRARPRPARRNERDPPHDDPPRPPGPRPGPPPGRGCGAGGYAAGALLVGLARGRGPAVRGGRGPRGLRPLRRGGPGGSGPLRSGRLHCRHPDAHHA